MHGQISVPQIWHYNLSMSLSNNSIGSPFKVVDLQVFLAIPVQTQYKTSILVIRTAHAN